MVMKRIFKKVSTVITALFIVATLTISPVFAIESNIELPNMSQVGDVMPTFSSESELEAMSANELLAIILKLSDKIDKGEASRESLISVVPVTLSKIVPVLSQSDMETIVSNELYPQSFRYFFMDVYRSVNTTNLSSYNTILQQIAQRESESDFMRRSAALSLNPNAEKNQLLKELFEQFEQVDDKGPILQRLAQEAPMEAKIVATSIISDYKNYDVGLVGLSNKVLVSTAQTAEDKNLILQLNKELLTSDNSGYSKIALFALSNWRTPESVNLVFENANFEDKAIQTFVRDNFDLVAKYLDSAPAEEIAKCIKAVPIKQFLEYLETYNAQARTSEDTLDVEALLKAIAQYNSPVIADKRLPGYVDYPGAAAYRDGVNVLGVKDWHGAIISDNPDVLAGEIMYFMQASGYKVHNDLEVSFVSESEFLDDGAWQGIRYWDGITYSEETDVINLATELAFSSYATYTFTNLMLANTSGLTTGDIIEPDRVTDFRCDGFVEYVYEYNGLRLQGEPNVWNIAMMSGYRKHSATKYRPSTQAASLYFVEISYP